MMGDKAIQIAKEYMDQCYTEFRAEELGTGEWLFLQGKWHAAEHLYNLLLMAEAPLVETKG